MLRMIDIVTIDKLIVTMRLPDTNGLNRLPHHLCQISAQNNYEADLVLLPRSKHGLLFDKPDLKPARVI